MGALPQNGVAYETYINLVDAAAPASFKAAPTLAAGDFKISKADGSLANLATLPTVEPAGSIWVKVSLGSGEMTTGKVKVQAIDAAGAEWHDLTFTIDVPDTNTETLWTDALTEAYPADGVSGVTPAQLIYSINQLLSEFARTGTSVSIKKRDGSEAYQLTLDSGITPTSSTQSS